MKSDKLMYKKLIVSRKYLKHASELCNTLKGFHIVWHYRDDVQHQSLFLKCQGHTKATQACICACICAYIRVRTVFLLSTKDFKIMWHNISEHEEDASRAVSLVPTSDIRVRLGV